MFLSGFWWFGNTHVNRNDASKKVAQRYDREAPPQHLESRGAFTLMAQRTTGFRSILSYSWAYDLLQNAVGVARGRRRFLSEFVKPIAGQRVLDIGCGTAAILEFLPDVDYLGLDLSEQYIATARQSYKNRGEFRVMQADEPLPNGAAFDIVLAIGLLHHLGDNEARSLFTNVRGVLADNGRLVTIDPTFVENQNRIARFLVQHDRGLYVRTPDELLSLASEFFASPQVSVRTDLLRIPWTHVVLQACGGSP